MKWAFVVMSARESREGVDVQQHTFFQPPTSGSPDEHGATRGPHRVLLLAAARSQKCILLVLMALMHHSCTTAAATGGAD